MKILEEYNNQLDKIKNVNDYNQLNYLQNNLLYAIYWMEHGHPKDKFNGIENIKVAIKYIW